MPLYADIVSDHNLERHKKRTEAYKDYLKAISAFLPVETRDFVLSDWYYSDEDSALTMHGSRALRYLRILAESEKRIGIQASESGCSHRGIGAIFTSHTLMCLLMV